MTSGSSDSPLLRQLQWRALLVGVVGSGLGLLGAVLNLEHFFRAYLLAYLFWSGLALGCLAILMLHHLVHGTWGAVIQRVLEAATRTLPLLVALGVPLVFGMEHLYEWSHPEAVAHDALLQHKSPYLNVPFFTQRAVAYFVIWLALAYGLNRWGRQLDTAHDEDTAMILRRRLQLLSGPGLVLYVLTVSFAAIDWVMSLEPHWYSTIYGIMLLVGQILVAMAFAIVVIACLAGTEPLSTVLVPGHWHDLGNLLLAFVMFWAYIAFSQFLIIWSGNLAEEIPWYVHRTHGGWQWPAMGLIVFHFALPFVVLLSRVTKRTPTLLNRVAAAMIVMHLLDVFWLVMPAFRPSHLTIHWLDLVMPVAMGGIWIVVFIWHLRRRPLLPLRSPRLQGVAQHG